MEKIYSPAIWFDGKFYTGKNHAKIIKEHSKDFIKNTDETPVQGFVTTSGRFVGRVEAADIAINADQVMDPKLIRHCGLMSEDLKEREF